MHASQTTDGHDSLVLSLRYQSTFLVALARLLVERPVSLLTFFALRNASQSGIGMIDAMGAVHNRQ